MLTAILALSLAHAELPKNYETLKATAKLQLLWQEGILATQYKELPPISGSGWGGILTQFKALGRLDETFDQMSDEMPEGKKKLVHAYGSVGVVQFKALRKAPYTGIFEGAHGLARLSLAAPPEKIGFTPGMALKFFVKGQPSVNVQVMETLNGQAEDQNFFAHAFTNTLPEPDGVILNTVVAFLGLFGDPLHRSVEEWAHYEDGGDKEDYPVAPDTLIFVPTADVQMSSKDKTDFRIKLARIPEDTVLYNVFASDPRGADPVLIGRLVLRSRFVASQYGDERLFFRHVR